MGGGSECKGLSHHRHLAIFRIFGSMSYRTETFITCKRVENNHLINKLVQPNENENENENARL